MPLDVRADRVVSHMNALHSMHTYVHKYICIRMYIFTSIYICIYIYIYMYTYMYILYVCLCVYIHTIYMYICIQGIHEFGDMFETEAVDAKWSCLLLRALMIIWAIVPSHLVAGLFV